jgi:6-phosphogluconolactonase
MGAVLVVENGAEMTDRKTRLVYIGSYTPDSSGGGRGTGISVFRQDPASGSLTPAGPDTPVSGPSFLAWHPSGQYLYATNERPDGAVTAFAVDDDGGLRALGSSSTGGADPCHLSVDPTGSHLVTANYSSGSVSIHPIGPDGTLGERTDLVRHEGTGPDPERQEGPHAHYARFDPAGSYVLVNDLGTDRIHAYRIVDGKLVSGPVTDLPAGTGPRHLVFGADNRVYVTGELDSTVSTFDYQPETGGLTLVDRVSSTGREAEEPNYPSEIVRSADSRYVYVANRGRNTVATFGTGSDGLHLLGEVHTGGDWPRHLMLLGDHLYVANQNSHTVGVFGLDPQTGLPAPVGTVAVPSPACLLAENDSAR